VNAVAARWPDVGAWLTVFLPEALETEGEPATYVREEKPSIDGDPALVKPYRQLLVAVFPGPRITPVTRTVRVTLQAWVVKENGLADLDAAEQLAGVAGYVIETAPTVGTPLNFAEIDSGPNRTKDSASAVEYMALTLVLEVNAL